jgi:hypothetical protein
MEKMLLWFEIAAAILLVHATLSACIVRFPPPEFRWLLYFMLCAPGVVGFGLLNAFVAHWRFDLGAEHFPFFYVASLAAVYLVGIVAIAWKGIRLRGEAERPPATKWPLGKLAAVAAIAVFVQSTTLAMMDLAARERISRWKAEAAAMSLSVAPHRPADSENAAPLYFQAIRNLRQDRAAKLESWLEPASGRGPQDLKDKNLRAYLQRHEADLALLREAARRPSCYFEREYGRPRIDILLPETQDTRFVVVMLSLHARVCASDGDLATAAKDVSAMFATSRHVAEEPFLISGLVAAAEHRLAIGTLVDLLNSAKLSEPQLAAFKVPRDLSFRQSLRRDLIFEEAMALGGSVEMLADPTPGESSDLFATAKVSLGPGGRGGRAVDVLGLTYPLSPRLQTMLPFYRVFLLSDEISHLRNAFQLYRETSSAASSTVPGSFKRTRETCEKLQRDMESKKTGLLPPLVWPALPSLERVFHEAETRTDLAQVVLAAARFRAKNGNYPDTLAALVPQFMPFVPLDAFSEQPIQLKIGNDGWTVFSTGTDEEGKRIELTLH